MRFPVPASSARLRPMPSPTPCCGGGRRAAEAARVRLGPQARLRIGAKQPHPFGVEPQFLQRAFHGRIVGQAFDIRIELGRVEARAARSEEHTSELQSLMRISYAVFCMKKKNKL